MKNTTLSSVSYETTSMDIAAHIESLRLYVHVLDPRRLGDVLRFKCLTCERRSARRWDGELFKHPGGTFPMFFFSGGASAEPWWPCLPVSARETATLVEPTGCIELPFPFEKFADHLLHEIAVEWGAHWVSADGLSLQEKLNVKMPHRYEVGQWR